MTDLTTLTAKQAADAIGKGELDATELFEAYRVKAAADDLNAGFGEPSVRSKP